MQSSKTCFLAIVVCTNIYEYTTFHAVIYFVLSPASLSLRIGSQVVNVLLVLSEQYFLFQ